jgi:hypothetical protein
LSDGNKKNSFIQKNQEQKLMTLTLSRLKQSVQRDYCKYWPKHHCHCKGLEEETNGVLHWEPFPEQPEQREIIGRFIPIV